MRVLETLLLASGVGKGVYERWRIQKLLPVLATSAMLATAAAAMMVTLVIGGMYATYLLLLQQGVGEASALLIVGLIVLFLTLGLIVALFRCVEQLKRMVSSPMNKTMDAFLNGLLAE